MFDQHANLVYARVAIAPVPANSGTTLTVQAGNGALFPDPPFNITVWPVDVLPLTFNAEILRVTAISGDVLTFTRQAEGSSVRSILVGDQVMLAVTKKTFTDIESVLQSAINREYFEQAFTNLSTISVSHNLGKKPAVTVINSAGDECIGEVHHTDNNNLIVTFTASFTGTVLCN